MEIGLSELMMLVTVTCYGWTNLTWPEALVIEHLLSLLKEIVYLLRDLLRAVTLTGLSELTMLVTVTYYGKTDSTWLGA
jgi:hypothetical protein